MTDADDRPFWKRKTLAQMSKAEWESLCDGCGRCCLNKIEYEDTGEIAYTDVGCRLLDGETCRCRDYPNRNARVKNCDRLTARNISRLNWLPSTCGYRLVDEGRDLYWWHPLVSGDPETVHAAGISVRGRVGLFEHRMGEEDLEDRIVDWPTKIPRRALRPPRNALSRSAPVKQSTQRQAAAESKRSDRPAKRRSRKT
ncbi:MAG: YcgN family cysteine cluster protein [Bradyrhizobiaceae bacterium]|nr:YcgN family cysteine cluster protein [Bradyrhizobiaceae bacterium]